MNEQATTPAISPPDASAGSKPYRVHLYLAVRVSVDVPAGASQQDAIAKALASTDFQNDFRGGEYAGEVSMVMVGEPGDTALLESTAYIPRVRPEQTGWTPTTGGMTVRPDVYRHLTLAQSHVSKDTMEWMESAELPDLCIGPYDLGCFVTVPVVDADIDLLDCPEDLKTVMHYARSIDCDVLRFDVDGDFIEALQEYAS